MKLSELGALLEAHRDKQFRLVLPGQSTVPHCFHITEVAHVQKRFIDCGGKTHSVDTCQLQAWVWNDTHHRLLAGKMADILGKATSILPEGRDLDIEIEYEDSTISQYPVQDWVVSDDAVVLHLTSKHTDCLAKGVCLPDLSLKAAGASECCAGSGCC